MTYAQARQRPTRSTRWCSVRKPVARCTWSTADASVSSNFACAGTSSTEPHCDRARRERLRAASATARECTVGAVEDPSRRFVELIARPEADVPLDEAALLIAAHDHSVDISAELGFLDDLAAQVPRDADASELARFLFVDERFAGNSIDYEDPRNSYLDDVLHRRLGIPITLSVVMLEVGRRCGLALDGVGMPGHFLVRAGRGRTNDAGYFDPYHGGEPLDAEGCRERFVQLHGSTGFRDSYLDPVGSRAILTRMLANLTRTFLRREPRSAIWALRLRLRIPGVALAERREASTLLGALGRFDEAADELQRLAGEGSFAESEELRQAAAHLRGRAN